MSKTKEAKRVRPEPQSGLQFSEDEAAQFGKLKIIKGVTEPIMWGASRLEVTVLSKTSDAQRSIPNEHVRPKPKGTGQLYLTHSVKSCHPFFLNLTSATHHPEQVAKLKARQRM